MPISTVTKTLSPYSSSMTRSLYFGKTVKTKNSFISGETVIFTRPVGGAFAAPSLSLAMICVSSRTTLSTWPDSR